MPAPPFLPDQKVFAKVRGYPRWPAKVCGLADETPNKFKYHVYFYGTRETAVCKLDELYDYLEYREKYGKPLKRKFFAEAIQEIESELEPSQRKDNIVSEKNSNPVIDKDSDDEGHLVIDESPSQKSKSKNDGNKVLKRKHSSGGNETVETPPIEITSRSGRKIKPKKFLDEPVDVNTSVTPKINRSKSGRENSFEENGKSKKPMDVELDMSNGAKTELHWNNSQKLQILLEKTEQSDPSKIIKKDFKKTLKKKSEEVKLQNEQMYVNNENLELLKIEVQLLDADCRIKTSLNLLKANCDECLQAMDEILDLKINALMLKKHPEVVDTVKKLRKYVGNLSEWKLTPEQEQVFSESASKIRAKADHMYNKFKNLFTVPNGKSFFEVYSSEVTKFQEKTTNLSTNEFYGLVRETTE